MSKFLHLARTLRTNPTEAEKKLWSHIRKEQLLGLKFRRQQEVDGYIVDFICFDKRLIIELDGGQHTEQVEYDEERTKVLESKGFLVLRFWNNDVMANIEGVLLEITNIVNPHPNPPPQGEGI